MARFRRARHVGRHEQTPILRRPTPPRSRRDCDSELPRQRSRSPRRPQAHRPAGFARKPFLRPSHPPGLTASPRPGGDHLARGRAAPVLEKPGRPARALGHEPGGAALAFLLPPRRRKRHAAHHRRRAHSRTRSRQSRRRGDANRRLRRDPASDRRWPRARQSLRHRPPAARAISCGRTSPLRTIDQPVRRCLHSGPSSKRAPDFSAPCLAAR